MSPFCERLKSSPYFAPENFSGDSQDLFSMAVTWGWLVRERMRCGGNPLAEPGISSWQMCNVILPALAQISEVSFAEVSEELAFNAEACSALNELFEWPVLQLIRDNIGKLVVAFGMPSLRLTVERMICQVESSREAGKVLHFRKEGFGSIYLPYLGWQWQFETTLGSPAFLFYSDYGIKAGLPVVDVAVKGGWHSPFGWTSLPYLGLSREERLELGLGEEDARHYRPITPELAAQPHPRSRAVFLNHDALAAHSAAEAFIDLKDGSDCLVWGWLNKLKRLSGLDGVPFARELQRRRTVLTFWHEWGHHASEPYFADLDSRFFPAYSVRPFMLNWSLMELAAEAFGMAKAIREDGSMRPWAVWASIAGMLDGGTWPDDAIMRVRALMEDDPLAYLEKAINKAVEPLRDGSHKLEALRCYDPEMNDERLRIVEKEIDQESFNCLAREANACRDDVFRFLMAV